MVRPVLIGSPLLGPAVWAPVARRLESDGWDVLVPAPYGEVGSPSDVLDHLAAALPPDEPLALVTHSNAGLYVGALAADHDVRAVVFVDAALPESRPTTATAPEPLRAFLAALVEPDGLLPPWSRWWPQEEVAALFPDGETRAAVEAEEGRLPLDYFEADVPSPPGWEELPLAYLAFGETYRAESDLARAQGWPVARLDGGHLHMLVDPAEVAGTLAGLLGRLGLESSR